MTRKKICSLKIRYRLVGEARQPQQQEVTHPSFADAFVVSIRLRKER